MYTYVYSLTNNHHLAFINLVFQQHEKLTTVCLPLYKKAVYFFFNFSIKQNYKTAVCYYHSFSFELSNGREMIKLIYHYFVCWTEVQIVK